MIQLDAEETIVINTEYARTGLLPFTQAESIRMS